MEVESVVTNTPRSRAINLSFRHLRGLAVDTGLHDVVLADGAVVYMDVPSPESDGIPLFDLEALR